MGLIGIAALGALVLVLRVLSNAFRRLGALTARLYDLPLFLPLWLEARSSAASGARGDLGAAREARS